MQVAIVAIDSPGDFGTFVRNLRGNRNVSLRGLSTRAGVDKSTLIRWEAGKSLPRLPELQAMLDALDASSDQRRQALEMIGAPRAVTKIREEDQRTAVRTDRDAIPIPMIGDLLRAMRQRRGKTVEEVAHALNVSTRSIRAWEHSDAWPNTEHLHRLCYTLGAAPSEVAALTAGNAWLTTLSPLPVSSSPNALDRMRAYLDSLFIQEEGFDGEAEAIKDIAYLALLARLAPLTLEHQSARPLLLNTYAGYATWLSNQHRYREAGSYAERALELKQGKGKQNPEWLRAAIISAHAIVYSGRHANMQTAVRVANPLLESVLPIAEIDHPVFEAWILSEMSGFAYIGGQVEAALKYSIHACDVAAKVNPVEYDLRRFDQAKLLVHLHRADEALTVLPAERTTCHPPRRMAGCLLRAEALLQLGNLAEAHDWLGKAYEIIHLHHLDSHEADLLAQQF